MDETVYQDKKYILCVFCLFGTEYSVARIFEDHGFGCLIPHSMRVVVKRGQRVSEQRKLLPGYIFVQTDTFTPQQEMFIRHTDNVIRILSYQDGSYALMDKDREFVAWLWQKNGALDVSRVYKEGDRIRVIDGPLKDHEGSIVSVNIKRRCVAIQAAGNSLLGKIWCSIEVVEKMDGSQASKT